MAATIKAGDAEVIVGRVTNQNEVLAEDLAEKAEECTSFMGSPVLATVGPPTWKPPEPDPDAAAGRDHLRALRAGLRRAQCQTRERRARAAAEPRDADGGGRGEAPRGMLVFRPGRRERRRRPRSLCPALRGRAA